MFYVNSFQRPLLYFRILVSLGLIGFVFMPAREVQAASITVNSLLNTTNSADGVCTIREAIINANNDAATWTNCPAGTGADVISFSVVGTITLTSALPNITDVDGLTINGGNNITISGNNLFRIVALNANAPATLQNITLTAGSVNGSGGAISNAGNLTIANVSFLNNLTITNVANDGGAINNLATGILTITNSTFTGNYTLDNGGAIHITGGTVSVAGSSFTNNNNAAIDDGGAIYLNAGTLTVSSSTFSGNRANEEGGAIFKNGGTLTIDGSSVFDGNISVNDGGGLYAINAGNTTITNSTFRNHIDAGINNGGAIYFATGTLNITGSTFTANRAPLNLGGALYFASGTGTISSTTFTGNNSQTNGGAIYKNGGNLTINNSVFDGNYSQTNGGAVYAANAGTLTIAVSTFQNQNNAVINSGGALFFNTGVLNITGSTFSANRAQDTGDQGGAIYINSGIATISDTDFLNNIADTYGGAVRVNGGTVTINSTSTFTGNTATANDGGAIYTATGVVTVSDSAFTNNAAGTDGGAIAVASGTLTLTNDAFTTNRADDGGALYHNSATLLTIANSTFTGNLADGEADGDGGAITLNSSAANSRLTLSGSTFSNNIANDDGGALWINAEPVTIITSTFSSNQARSGNGAAEGGAIYNSANADATSIRLSTFTNNTVAATANVNALGGAIANYGAAFVLANDTFSSNAITKTTAGAGNAQGGALYSNDAATIHNVTFNSNSTAESGTGTADGGSLYRVAGVVTVANSIFANSTENGAAGNCGGVITNGGNNIHFSGADCPAAFTNVNPDLAALIGTPAYFPLNLASPAINAGNNAICALATTTNNQSQNGVVRPVGVNCDIGSYELPDPPPTVLTITRVNPSPTTVASVDFLVTFSESVTGGATTNFTLTTTGTLAGASVTSVSAGPGATRTVTVNTGLGDGTLRLDMANSTGVADGGANPLTNVPFTTGEAYTLDRTAPDTTITSNPTNPTASVTAAFTFTGSDVGGSGVALFQCQLDGSGFGVCVSPQNYVGLSDGSHTFDVRAVDNAGNVDASPASFSWIVDTVSPDTSFTTTPATPSNSSSAAFTFTGTDSGSGIASFQCQLDGSGFGACTSPQNYLGLTDGSHTFEVRAIDNAGNIDPTPASYTWVVDTTAPDTTLTSNPTNPTASTSASFSFTGSDVGGTGVASFECQLDGGGFGACTSPQNYVGLSDGSHTFDVRAIDVVGNVDVTPASYTWIVDATEPDTTITSNPLNPTANTSATFTFTGSDPGGLGIVSFECQLDGGVFSTCNTPQNYAGLTNGSHTFEVRAIDSAGNIDTSPASYTWVVDITPPDTTIVTNPPNPDNDTTSAFTFTSTDPSATFECRMDGGLYAICNSGDTFGPLVDGAHTFDMRAIDSVGNIDPTPASYAWTIDSTAPDTNIDSNPPNPDNDTTPAFTFSSLDLTAAFACQIDGGGYSACNSGDTFGPLADGTHTFDVRAVDPLGNADPSPASYTWAIDSGAPDTTITSNPPNLDNNIAPTFTFSSPDPLATFECQLDGGGFAACTTPLHYVGLSAGSHTFEVRAVDVVNNVDPTPASFTWMIDLGFPTVTGSTPTNNTILASGPTQLIVTFSEDMKNDGSLGAANNSINYLLVEDGANNIFNTLSCAGGLIADDTQIVVDAAVYTNNAGAGPFVATLNINSSVALPVGKYRLFVCGTTSIEDLVGNELNDGISDALINFTVQQNQSGGRNFGIENQPVLGLLPATGFPQNAITHLPIQPADKAYTSTDLWLEIPKLGVKMSIVGVPQTQGGWDVTWLNKDAGWLNNSAYPTWNGNSVITAHVWDALNKPGPFAQLKSLKYGDQVKIHAFGQVYTYEIRVSQTVLPSNLTSVFKHEDRSWVTLVTCEDYKEQSGMYSYRRMIRAVLISVTEEK